MDLIIGFFVFYFFVSLVATIVFDPLHGIGQRRRQPLDPVEQERWRRQREKYYGRRSAPVQPKQIEVWPQDTSPTGIILADMALDIERKLRCR